MGEAVDKKGQLVATFERGECFGNQIFKKEDTRYDATVVAKPDEHCKNPSRWGLAGAKGGIVIEYLLLSRRQ